MKFTSIILGGLLLSTALMAADVKQSLPAPQKATQQLSPQESLKLLKEVHSHNEVFDNYHTGGIPYEPPATLKGK